MTKKTLTLRGDQTKFEKKTLTPSQQRYLKRQSKDQYTKAAAAQGYRSRAAYKLLEIEDKYRLLPVKNPHAVVLDLGAAPGGWAQVVQQLCPNATIIASDILPIEPFGDVTFIQGDFTEDGVLEEIQTAISNTPVHIVLSDMAPNTIGHAATDHLRSMILVEAAADCALQVLSKGGHFACKLFQGGEEQKLRDTLRPRFEKIGFYKPPSSRSESREQFLIAQGFKG